MVNGVDLVGPMICGLRLSVNVGTNASRTHSLHSTPSSAPKFLTSPPVQKMEPTTTVETLLPRQNPLPPAALGFNTGAFACAFERSAAVLFPQDEMLIFYFTLTGSQKDGGIYSLWVIV